jgi:hypothetical protein
MAVTVLLPPWYIYCLVAVLSLFRLMEKKENKDRFVLFAWFVNIGTSTALLAVLSRFRLMEQKENKDRFVVFAWVVNIGTFPASWPC